MFTWSNSWWKPPKIVPDHFGDVYNKVLYEEYRYILWDQKKTSAVENKINLK